MMLLFIFALQGPITDDLGGIMVKRQGEEKMSLKSRDQLLKTLMVNCLKG
jgi:hypothetical protein